MHSFKPIQSPGPSSETKLRMASTTDSTAFCTPIVAISVPKRVPVRRKQAAKRAYTVRIGSGQARIAHQTKKTAAGSGAVTNVPSHKTKKQDEKNVATKEKHTSAPKPGLKKKQEKKEQPRQIEYPQNKVKENKKATDEEMYLEQALEKRRAEKQNQTPKSPRKPRKRGRPTASSMHMKKTASLKDSFQAYMDEISREELLNQTEVVQLADDIKLGVEVEVAQKSLETTLGRRPSVPELAKELQIDVRDVQKRLMLGTAAKNKLVAANLRLVASVARKVALSKGSSTAGLALDDMVQEGSVGLIRAAEKFDAGRGYKFSTYATWWVKAFIMRSITTQSRSIKVPSSVVDEYARIRKKYESLRVEGINNPTEEAVAKELGITTAKLRFVVNVVTRVPTSLDLSLSPDRDAGSRTLGELIEGDDDIEGRLVKEMQDKELDLALKECLRPLERAVIRLRFGLDDGQPRTLKETGNLLGLSKERIRQLIYKALPKMKTPEIQRMLVDATTR